MKLLRNGLMNKEECLKIYILLLEGMVEKSQSKLEEALSKYAHLYHISGQCENREEYIKDILNGVLNYYDYQIISYSDKEFVVKLLAKVYSGSKSWWKLKMTSEFVFEDHKYKIISSKVTIA